MSLAADPPELRVDLPLAAVVLGGLLTSLALHMVVVPVLFLRYGMANRE